MVLDSPYHLWLPSITLHNKILSSITVQHALPPATLNVRNGGRLPRWSGLRLKRGGSVFLFDRKVPMAYLMATGEGRLCFMCKCVLFTYS